MNTDTAAKSAQQTAGTQDTKTNKAAVESRVESRVESDAKREVKREEAGKSAAEEMRKENAITTKPEEGIELQISKKGLEKEQQAKASDEKKQAVAQDDKSATEKRIEEQQKVKEKIREMVKKETDDEEQKLRQTERRDEDRKEREKVDRQEQQDDEDRKQRVTNYAGYTNAQLQQMAQRGEISQNDYRTEIENREEKIAEKQQTLSDNDQALAKGIDKKDTVERQMGAVETAFDEESNTNINAQTRAKIVQDLENPQNKPTQQEDVQRDQQARAFAQWQNDFGFLIR